MRRPSAAPREYRLQWRPAPEAGGGEPWYGHSHYTCRSRESLPDLLAAALGEQGLAPGALLRLLGPGGGDAGLWVVGDDGNPVLPCRKVPGAVWEDGRRRGWLYVWESPWPAGAPIPVGDCRASAMALSLAALGVDLVFRRELAIAQLTLGAAYRHRLLACQDRVAPGEVAAVRLMDALARATRKLIDTDKGRKLVEELAEDADAYRRVWSWPSESQAITHRLIVDAAMTMLSPEPANVARWALYDASASLSPMDEDPAAALRREIPLGRLLLEVERNLAGVTASVAPGRSAGAR